MNKNILIILSIGLFISLGIIFLRQPSTNSGVGSGDAVQNVEIKDGVQYVSITAKGGYSPKVSNAQANIPTKLVVKTNDTYDCSLSLVIRSIGYQKILPKTGEEIIDLGTPQAGELRGLCSMGMYNFVVNFK